jgi:REP element-mobilizing transposase RayT
MPNKMMKDGEFQVGIGTSMILCFTLSKKSDIRLNMPRKARIDAPGALHHIIVRGIERTKIFRYNYDRKNFLHRLSELIPETRTDCFAWTLTPNHFHLLLKTGSVPISVLMNRLLTGYAGWFNKKHKRHGQLFQNRYKSILCQEDLYFKELVRYIHLNPLRSEIVSDMNELDTYPWCGHSVIMGNNSQSWHNIDYVHGFFSKKKRAAVKKYRSFVKKGLSESGLPDLSGGGLVRSAGGWTELKAIRKTDAFDNWTTSFLGTIKKNEHDIFEIHSIIKGKPMPTQEMTPQEMIQKLIIQEIEKSVPTMPEYWLDQLFSVNEMSLLKKMYTHIMDCSNPDEIGDVIFHISSTSGKNALKYRQNL